MTQGLGMGRRRFFFNTNDFGFEFWVLSFSYESSAHRGLCRRYSFGRKEKLSSALRALLPLRPLRETNIEHQVIFNLCKLFPHKMSKFLLLKSFSYPPAFYFLFLPFATSQAIDMIYFM